MQLYYQDPKDPADKTVIGFLYSDFLEDDTIGGSSWTVAPDGELVITDASSTPSATVITVAEGVAGTTYRLTNVITTANGLQESRTAILPVSADALIDAYLGVSEAAARLWGRYGIESDLTAGDLVAATREVDAMGPWIGYKYGSEQELAFPRSITPSGEAVTSDAIPDDVLDSVCLLAHHLATDEGPAVTSESVLDRSLTYATPKESKELLQVDALLLPYYRKAGYRK